jgi:hypothetical protein
MNHYYFFETFLAPSPMGMPPMMMPSMMMGGSPLSLLSGGIPRKLSFTPFS